MGKSSFNKSKIFEPQQRFQKSQRRKGLWNAIFILMGLAGIGVLLAVFIVDGIATVEKVKSPVKWWWYAIGGGLTVPSIIFSVWNIFWFQAMFAYFKQRGGRGEYQRLMDRRIKSLRGTIRQKSYLQ